MKCGHTGCDYSHENLATFRQHYRRVHHEGFKVKPTLTPEERRVRQRGYEKKHRKKKQAAARVKKALSARSEFTPRDADKRGVFLAENPIVAYQKSRIPEAGNGVFARVDLQVGDVVTRYEGELVENLPSDREYVIQVDDAGYLDGLRTPAPRKGLGSFVNREARTMGRCRKNCDIVPVGRGLYVQIMKKVKAGQELYTTYSRGYRIGK
jgi:hypothetical protein